MPPSNEGVSPQSSAAPLISSGERHPGLLEDDNANDAGDVSNIDSKSDKRRFFGLGKKKEDKQPQKDRAPSSLGSMPPPQPHSTAMGPPSPSKGSADLKPQSQAIPISPRIPQQSTMAASPSRLRSSSPRLHSPASSEIFERNVQEPIPISTLQGELSPAHIPSHVITEDHIPPSLEASAEAITSETLNADEVEIVMSTSHQPAGSMLEGSSSHVDLTQLHTPLSALHHVRSEDSEASVHRGSLATEDDGASTYGQLDPTDPRRLSFISFADVVQSEHQQAPTSAVGETGHRDSLQISSFPSNLKQERAASPLRSPRSPGSFSGGVTTPPSVVNANPMSLDQSPGRSGLASPTNPHSELTIETMRQAVRRTASGDLGGVRSAGMSPISDENLHDASRSRTNS